jgi:RNA polymerase sigma-70 factor (ECF subfamily)
MSGGASTVDVSATLKTSSLPDTYLRASRDAWPRVTLDPAHYLAHLARVSVGRELPPVERAVELWLTCACARGVRGAVEALERTYFPDVRAAVARIDASSAFVDEACQVLREKLLVGKGGAEPKIAGFAGRATLRSWLAAAATRTALNLRRNRDERPYDALSSGLLVGAPPELEHIRLRYKAPFEGALREALSSLPARERALLRMHVIDKMSIDRLAVVFRVGRSTAARRLAEARLAVLDGTRRRLQARLGMTGSEFRSLAALVRTEIDVSLAALLHD